jgi:hypothetical protein
VYVGLQDICGRREANRLPTHQQTDIIRHLLEKYPSTLDLYEIVFLVIRILYSTTTIRATLLVLCLVLQLVTALSPLNLAAAERRTLSFLTFSTSRWTLENHLALRPVCSTAVHEYALFPFGYHFLLLYVLLPLGSSLPSAADVACFSNPRKPRCKLNSKTRVGGAHTSLHTTCRIPLHRMGIDREQYYSFNMAYNGTGERGFRGHEASLLSPPRTNGSTRLPQPLQDGRSGGLMRRFTTDSSRVPTLSTISVQRGQQDSSDFGPSVCTVFLTTIPSHHPCFSPIPSRTTFSEHCLLTGVFFRHLQRSNCWRRKNSSTKDYANRNDALRLRCNCWTSSSDVKNRNLRRCKRISDVQITTTRDINRNQPLLQNIESLPRDSPQSFPDQIVTRPRV